MKQKRKKLSYCMSINSRAFISLFVYLYNIMIIISYINALYNGVRVVRRGWENKINRRSL